MATNKAILYNGKEYLWYGKTQGYVRKGLEYSELSKDDKRNREKYLSRRQAEKVNPQSTLSKQGFRTFEEKAKYRKEKKLTPDVKTHTSKNGQTYYSIRFKTQEDVKKYLKTINKSKPVYITAQIEVFDYDVEGDEKGVKMWFSVTSYSVSSVLLKKDFDAIIENKFGEYSAKVIKYEIRFTLD